MKTPFLYKLLAFKKDLRLSYFVLIASFINLLLYHLPFFRFASNNIDTGSFNGVLLVVSLTVLAFILNAFVFYLGLLLLRIVGKWMLVLLFNMNAVAVYFVNTYGVIIDKSMIGNVLNTNYEESTSFISLTLFIYLILLGCIPSILIYKLKIINEGFKKSLIYISLSLVSVFGLVYANASNWLWIDKHSKTLGALVMPWSYVVNTSRFYIHKSQENEEQVLLPNASVKDSTKSIAVLVVGESARSANFSLYGYEKNTNPLLSTIEGIKHYNAESCATYTTAGVKCILDHKHTSTFFEILPNYLFRNDVEVIWRTNNWGEPPIRINNYQRRKDLKKNCEGTGCDYDEIVLSGLKEQIAQSKKNKILVVLHTSTSHGPTYFSKYPEAFNTFTPICESVELATCTQEELMNAYDNTIVYTDYILATLINELKQLEEYRSTMIYVSDHGESLGENNLYMHGIPVSIAPKEQLEIPLIVWTEDSTRALKDIAQASQHNVFHSVLDFLAIESPIYNETLSVFK